MTLREAITAAGVESEYLAGDYAAVVASLNAKVLTRYDKASGGWEKCEAAGLTSAEIGAVVATIDAVATSGSEHAVMAKIGLNFFLAAKLDFSRDDSQSLFAALPVLSGGAVTEEVAAKLMHIGRKPESYADQHNGGVDWVEADIAAMKLEIDIAYAENEIIVPAANTREAKAAAYVAASEYLLGN